MFSSACDLPPDVVSAIPGDVRLGTPVQEVVNNPGDVYPGPMDEAPRTARNGAEVGLEAARHRDLGVVA